MKKLLFLFLSILLSFCSINPANAQSQTFTNITCGQITNCPSYYAYAPFGEGISAPFSETQKQNFLDNICKAKTNNNNSISTNHSTERYWDMLINFDNTLSSSSFYHVSQGYKITSITCEVPKPKIPGCTNPEATNYNSQATEDNGTCILPPPPPPKIPGCTNPNALNYNPDATEENGTCQEKIEGCTDQTAINYNPQANVHKESMCEYPPPYTPQDITASFEKSQVSIGATTWTLRFNLNVADASLDFNNIQTWNKFKAISATTSDKTITLTLRQFDDQRLDVECTNYEVTIPRRALVTPQGDTNANPISGNFEVVGCNKNTDPQDPNSQNQDEENKPQYENTIKEDNFYLSLYDTDENGKVYLNLTNIIYFVGFLSFFSVLFFVLFGFIKNSFLGKSRKSSR